VIIPSLADMDRLARFFGVHLSKTNEKERHYQWSSDDGSISGEYGEADLPPILGFTIAKPVGEPFVLCYW